METKTINLSGERVALIEWHYYYPQTESDIDDLLRAKKGDTVLIATGKVRTVTIVAPKYRKAALVLGDADMQKIVAGMTLIAQATKTCRADQWEF